MHKIQLVVKQGLSSKEEIGNLIRKCRSIATHFHHSTMAQDELKKIQGRLQEPILAIIHDSPTRWNSTLYMMKRTQELQELLCIYVATNSKIDKISNTE